MVHQGLFIWSIFSTWQADNHRHMFRLSDSKMNLEFPSGQPLVSSPVIHVCNVEISDIIIHPCLHFIGGMGEQLNPEKNYGCDDLFMPKPKSISVYKVLTVNDANWRISHWWRHICRHRIWSTLIRVMTCWLGAPSTWIAYEIYNQ